MKVIKLVALFMIFSFLNGQAFFPGEKYEYDVFYKFIKLGHATIETAQEIEVIENQEAYHVTYTFRTTKFGDRIYKVRDRLDLWINKDSFQLIKQEKRLREKKWKNDSVIIMRDNIAIINGEEREAPDFFYNTYALVLILRDFNILENESKQFVTFEKKIKLIEIENIGYKLIKTPVGIFNSYIYKPSHNGKPALKDSGDLELAYCLMENNIVVPVQITIKLNKGYGTIDLKLKHSHNSI